VNREPIKREKKKLMNFSDCLLVGAGGFVGAVCRFGIAHVSRLVWATSFPMGTLVANLAGCFLIGVLIGSGKADTSQNLRLSFGVGFLGALTTFSTFGAETIQHAQSGAAWIAGVNVTINLVGGLGAVLVGIALGQRLFQRVG
jgi:CrcB protein